MFEIEDVDDVTFAPNIKVIGVGGAGSAILWRLVEDNITGVNLVAINTNQRTIADLQRLGAEIVDIGGDLTKGLGAGGDPNIGENAALQNEATLQDVIRNTDLVFITAGLGGGVGSGATPVIAKIAKDLGVLSIGVVTLPFTFEGRRRMKIARMAIEKMKDYFDALIVIENDSLMKLETSRKMSVEDAFKASDGILRQGIRLISDLVLVSGTINIDFADLKTILRQSPKSDAILGIGESTEGKAVDAVKNAIKSPLLSRDLKGAKGIILNIIGYKDMTMEDVNDIAEYIRKLSHPDLNLIFGLNLQQNEDKVIRIMLIATDFAESEIKS